MKDFPDDMSPFNVIHGSGGGGKGGGGGSLPEDDPDTLRSKAVATFVELLGEGQNSGLVDGAKSIFLDDTPIQNEDGSFNFQGIEWNELTGTVDQPPLDGISASENERSVGVQVDKANGGVTRTITNTALDELRVRIQLDGLFKVDGDGDDTGQLEEWDVGFKIEVKPNGGEWTNPFPNRRAVYSHIDSNGDDTDHFDVPGLSINGKSSSPYERGYRFKLPGEGPWDVRVTRLSEDVETDRHTNSFKWTGYTEILSQRLTYPYCHVIGVKVDTSTFGTNVPVRRYHIKGRIVEVPSNYDPETRTLSGLWDGTFKLAWTDNPVWCYRDLLLNPRYGLGRTVKSLYIDDATLYVLAQYCDQDVPDGRGGMEPRFTLNVAITNQREAFEVVNDMASVFRGLTFWAAGSLTATADIPKQPEMLVTNSGVVEGRFNRAGTSVRSRANAVIVRYNDPDDMFRVASVVESDNWAVIRDGYRPKTITAFGCASKGQAQRIARWMLLTEQNQRETITYRAGDDHAWVAPGSVVQIMDNDQIETRWAGRVKSRAGTAIELDGQISEDAANGADFLYTDTSGTVQRVAIDSFDRSGDTTTVHLVRSIDGALPSGFQYAIVDSEATVEPETVRVLRKTEVRKGQYEITAVEYIESKFNQTENGIDFTGEDQNQPPVSTGPVLAPRNLNIEFGHREKRGAESDIEAFMSWTPPNDARITGYRVKVKVGEKEWVSLGTDDAPSRGYVNAIRPGDRVRFKVMARTDGPRHSGWVESGDFYAVGRTKPGMVGYDLSATATKEGITVRWQNPDDSAFSHVSVWRSASDDFTTAYVIEKTPGTQIFDTQPGQGETVYYWITVHVYGNDAPRSAPAGPVSAQIPEQRAPDTPENLAVESEATENGFASVIVTWDSVPGATRYDTEYSDDGGVTWLSIMGSQNRTSTRVVRGTEFLIRVSAVNTYGRSEPAGPVEHIAARDTTPPEPPTGLTAKSGFGTIWLDWLDNTESDLRDYEIFEQTDATPVPGEDTEATFTTPASTFLRSGLPGNATRNYWVRAVDTSRNKSGWSEVATAKTPATEAITAEALDEAIQDTEFAQNIEAVKVRETLPETKIGELVSVGGELYRWKGDKYTKSVSPDDLSDPLAARHLGADSVAAAAIQAGAVSADQLAANAISASKLLISNLTNLIADANLEDPDYWSGGVTFTPNTSETPASWGGENLGRLAGPSDQYVIAQSSKIKVEPGSALYASYKARVVEGEGSVFAQLRFYPSKDAAEQSHITTLPPVTGTGIAEESVLAKVPDAALYVSLVIVKDKDGTTDAYFCEPIIREAMDGRITVDGAVEARHLTTDNAVITQTAQIAEAIITDAHIANLSAGKLTVAPDGSGLPIALTIGASGATLGSVAQMGSQQLYDVMDELWEQSTGNALTLHSSLGVSAGRYSLASSKDDDTQWAYSKSQIPFDPRKTYKITFSARMGGGGGAGSFYLGLEGIAADGKTLVNQRGDDTHSSQHYVVASGASRGQTAADGQPIDTDGEIVDFVGYVRGHSDSPNGDCTLQSPHPMHSNVRYIRPMAIFNYNGTPGDNDYFQIDAVKIETVETDVADIVNAGSTNIWMGKIQVNGDTSLADWRAPDSTSIDGGMIYTNSIMGRSLQLSEKGIFFEDVRFETNGNTLSWTGSAVRYMEANGAYEFKPLDAGSATYSGNALHIYYQRGENRLRSSTNPNHIVEDGEKVLVATYRGGSRYNVNYGSTIVDGDHIQTNAVNANHIQANAVRANHVQANSIRANHIQVSSLSAISGNFGSLQVDSANIKNLAVDTIKIANGAVSTKEVGTNSNKDVRDNDDWYQVISFNVHHDGLPVKVWAVMEHYITDGDRTDPDDPYNDTRVRLRLGSGKELARINMRDREYSNFGFDLDFSSNSQFNVIDEYPTAGNSTYYLEVKTDHSHLQIERAVMYAEVLKK